MRLGCPVRVLAYVSFPCGFVHPKRCDRMASFSDRPVRSTALYARTLGHNRRIQAASMVADRSIQRLSGTTDVGRLDIMEHARALQQHDLQLGALHA